jgi:hypothetical protein
MSLKLTAKQQHALSVLFLLILPVFLFNPTILGDKEMVAHDIEQWRASAESVLSYVEKTGEIGLWVPNMFSGMPSYTVSFKQVVPHLDTIIFPLTKFIYPAFPYWVLLIGCYVFLLQLGVRKSVAVFGAVLIGFSTYFPIILGAGHNSKFITMSYIPWLFWGYQLFVHSDKKWKGLFAFALAFMFNLRGGHPQVTYYFFYLLAIWWAFDTYEILKVKKDSKKWMQLTGGLMIAGILGLLANMQQIWSIAEYGNYSIRGGSALAEVSSTSGSGLNLEYAFAWSQGWFELLTTILPNSSGGSSLLGTYWGPKSFTSGPHYFGLLTWLFTIPAILLVKSKVRWVLLSTFILTMIFSLGYHFELINGFAFKFIPLFNKFRTPEMWLIVTGFSLSTLAALGLNEVLTKIEESKQKKLLATFKPILYGIAFILLVSVVTKSIEPQKDGEIQQIASIVAQQNGAQANNPQVVQYARNYVKQNVEARKKLINDDLTRAFIMILVIGGALFLAYRKTIPLEIAVVVVLLVASYDMLSTGKKYIPNSIFKSNGDVTATLKAKKRPVDAYIQQNNSARGNWSYRTYRLDQSAFRSADQAFFYPIIGGYNGAKLSIYQDLIERALPNGQFGFHPGILSMLNVKFLTAPRGNLPLNGYETVFESEKLQVIENKNVLPKAWFADSLVAVSTPKQAMDVISNPVFDPKITTVVENNNLATTVFKKDSLATIEVMSYDNHALDLTVKSDSDQFLVLSEIYYPAGWKAYLDEIEIPIHKTNYVLRGVEVPAGEHTISMRLEPTSFIWGSRLSWIGNSLILLLGVVAFIPNNNVVSENAAA